MAYNDIGDAVPGATVPASWGDQVRANFQAGVPDIFTTKGDLAVATGSDAADRLAVGADDSTLVAASGESTGLAWQIQPAARVYNSSAINPATSTWVTVTCDSERFDINDMHSTVTNTGRLTVPANGDGLYFIGGCVEFATSNQNPTQHVRILLNGSTEIARQTHRLDSATGTNTALNVSCLYSLSATDYVELQVYTTEDVNVQASGNYSPEFWAIWQRRA